MFNFKAYFWGKDVYISEKFRYDSNEILTAYLGDSRTHGVMWGNSGSNRQLQMIECSLMTVDELKSMPKGHFIVMKTAAFSAQRIMRPPDENAAQAVLQIGYLVRGSVLDRKKSERKVQYADCREVEAAVPDKFPPKE